MIVSCKSLSLWVMLWVAKPPMVDLTGTWLMQSVSAHHWTKEFRFLQAGETVLGESWDRSSGLRGKIKAQVFSGNQIVGTETLSNGQSIDFRWVVIKSKLEGRMWQNDKSNEIHASKTSESIPVFKYFDRVQSYKINER